MRYNCIDTLKAKVEKLLNALAKSLHNGVSSFQNLDFKTIIQIKWQVSLSKTLGVLSQGKCI